jgi:hypothetical protein
MEDIMRVIDLRVRAKDKSIAEGNITSIKFTAMDKDTGIIVTLDEGYSIIISMSEFDAILDYINTTEYLNDENNERSKSENKLDGIAEPTSRPDIQAKKERENPWIPDDIYDK